MCQVLLYRISKIFQLTRSRGAWQAGLKTARNIRYFNSHAHVERDYHDFCYAAHKRHFNSHAHVERDSRRCLLFLQWRYFNSHAHVERDLWLRSVTTRVFINFNSHAHVERDWWYCFFFVWSLSFQLTRSRGAWQSSKASGTFFFNFNSHAHVERDQLAVADVKWFKHFNSHAHVERDE